jgi:hypothetical protein
MQGHRATLSHRRRGAGRSSGVDLDPGAAGIDVFGLW